MTFKYIPTLSYVQTITQLNGALIKVNPHAYLTRPMVCVADWSSFNVDSCILWEIRTDSTLRIKTLKYVCSIILTFEICLLYDTWYVNIIIQYKFIIYHTDILFIGSIKYF